MSDFIISIGRRYSPEVLLSLLKRPYGELAPGGQCFGFEWGSAAILTEHLADGNNIFAKDNGVFAWVGDLVGEIPHGLVHQFIGRIKDIHQAEGLEGIDLKSDKLFGKLNGAFAIMWADETGFCVVTDPMNFTQVFAGLGCGGEAAAFGTQQDLVAAVSDSGTNLDIVSIAQVLLTRYCTFPNTMYTNVAELKPGSVHGMNLKGACKAVCKNLSYWSVPDELRSGYSETELAEELSEAVAASVRDRAAGGGVAVALSGGLDSRLVMAAVPKELECMGLTLCDELNRETKVAEKVAKGYGHAWFPLFREEDYLANNLVDIVKFIGFDCEFVHAHLFGFADLINKKTKTLFTGDLFDTIIRAYCAKDFIFCKQWGRGRPGYYKKVQFEYPYRQDNILDEFITDNIHQRLNARISGFYKANIDQKRSSVAEWLKIYPFRHWVEAATWSAQRRVLPLKLVGADRRLLDFAFRCPVELKLGNKIFMMAAKKLLGSGLYIPSANDGIKPCSGEVRRMAERSIRKLQDMATGIMVKFGRKKVVQHSWHDYQMYWSQSKKIAQFVHEYGANLAQLDGVLFKGKGQTILESKNTEWHYAFRLLHLAIWLQIVKDHRKELGKGEDKQTSALQSSAGLIAQF
ncbi:MAG: hypothetical protein A2Y07_05665 [Planctomycetes bacterium GWF2_50_10]|nr:MAG: hypothetical protein A2Y07_05665 [Planctomycetes bacterium GWF2_50_10]